MTEPVIATDEISPVIDGIAEGISLTGDFDGETVGVIVGAAVMYTSQHPINKSLEKEHVVFGKRIFMSDCSLFQDRPKC